MSDVKEKRKKYEKEEEKIIQIETKQEAWRYI